jgi:chromate reductase
MQILGISGSLRRHSYNHALLRQAAERLPSTVDLIEFEKLREIPAYDADLEEPEAPVPAAVAALRADMRKADAVLIATPEYNSSIPGALKNALDWASRPAGDSALMGTPAAVIGASTGMFGAVWAQAELRKVLGALGARVIDVEVPIPFAAQNYEDGRLQINQQQTHALDELLAELIRAVEERYEARAAAAARSKLIST